MANKYIRFVFLFVIFALSHASAAKETYGLSQRRNPQKPYTFYIGRHIDLQNKRINHSTTSLSSVYESAKPIEQVDFQKVQLWNSENLNTAFENVRDVRFIDDTKNTNFKRRSTWLFPDDGCYARAELAIMNLTKLEYNSPNKIFAFGNLRANTSNSTSGEVTWWYHVAPIIRVGNVSYVLDPAIDSKKPLEVNDWLEKMGASPSELTVAICSSNSYDPYSSCEEKKNKYDYAYKDQLIFLDQEWDRQIELGRDPNQVLGDSPPWSN